MFANFTATGLVREVTNETTQNGTSGTSVVIKTGEWQGQNDGGEDFLRFTVWKERQEMAYGISQGDLIAVSGRLQSKKNQRGYWNTNLMVNSIVVVQKGQQQGYQQQPQQQTQQPVQNTYSDQDIPF